MKRFYAILLTTLLLGGMGFPLLSQVNPERSVMEAPEKVKIKMSENRLTIENLPKDDILEIYNIMGVKVFSRRVKTGTNEYTLTLPKGFSLLKIGKITKKIAIS
jgi:predicted peroxiredoxin